MVQIQLFILQSLFVRSGCPVVALSFCFHSLFETCFGSRSVFYERFYFPFSFIRCRCLFALPPPPRPSPPFPLPPSPVFSFSNNFHYSSLSSPLFSPFYSYDYFFSHLFIHSPKQECFHNAHFFSLSRHLSFFFYPSH